MNQAENLQLESPIIKLSDQEVLEAAVLGIKRRLAAYRAGLVERYQNGVVNWDKDVNGALGERAAYKWAGVPFDYAGASLDKSNGRKAADLADRIDTKCRDGSKPGFNDLMITSNEPADFAYMLVHYLGPAELQLVGYATGRELHEYGERLVIGRTEFRYYRPEQLRPVAGLRDYLEEWKRRHGIPQAGETFRLFV